MKNKKTVSIIVILLVAILSIAMVILYNNEKQIPKPVSNETKQIDTKTIILKKSEDINLTEIKKYKNKNGYEISYPSDWNELNLADVYGDQKDLSANHYFSPSQISEGLQRILVKPTGCGDTDYCQKHFEKYSKLEYSLFRIYAQKFQVNSKFPTIQIKEAEKKEIIFSDGTKGIMWNKNNGEMIIIVINDNINNYRYQIIIRNIQEHGLNFEKDILPILSTFRLTK